MKIYPELKDKLKGFSPIQFIRQNPKPVIFAVALALMLLSPVGDKISIEKFSSIVESARDMPSAPLVYLAAYILGVVLALPGIAFMFLGGSLFGFWKGLALALIASNIGCQFTFFISRFLGRDFVSKFFKVHGFMGKISDKLEKNGLMVMVYLRLIPLFPFNLVNYASGLTNIRYRDYALGTFIGKIPAMVIYVYISSTFDDFENSKHRIPIYIGVFLVFTAFTLILEKKQKVFK